MWAEGALGEDRPRQLSDTILYLLGINLALRGGEEHRNLRRPGFNSQLRIGRDSDGVCCLIFREDMKSKTNQGGLDCRKFQPRTIYINENNNSARCPVRLFQKYVSLLPPDGVRPDFYLHPLGKPTMTQWYADHPIGINTLRMTMKCLAESAGIQG